MKKEYISPQTISVYVGVTLPIAESQLLPTQGNQSITLTNEEYDGVFGSRYSLWDDEEE